MFPYNSFKFLFDHYRTALGQNISLIDSSGMRIDPALTPSQMQIENKSQLFMLPEDGNCVVPCVQKM